MTTAPVHSIKKVCGVGLNDASYSVSRYKVVNGKSTKIWTCPFYRAWLNMIRRCYSPSVNANRPSYSNVYVCEDWLTFSKFKSWMIDKDHIGKHLDKDILSDGVSVYSPKTCCFIDPRLNLFLTDHAAARGSFLCGVHFDKQSGKFKSQCSNPFTKKRECLGFFENEKDAHIAWLKRKHKIACMYADLQSDTRVSFALRNMYEQKLIDLMLSGDKINDI